MPEFESSPHFSHHHYCKFLEVKHHEETLQQLGSMSHNFQNQNQSSTKDYKIIPQFRKVRKAKAEHQILEKKNTDQIKGNIKQP